MTKIDTVLIENYISNLRVRAIRARGNGRIRVYPVDSEKRRNFFVTLDSRLLFMKLNMPFWDEEHTQRKMLNEKKALEILQAWKVRYVPKMYLFDSGDNVFNTEVLLMDYIPDTIAPLNNTAIVKLVAIVQKMHAITSRRFTVPYGDFTRTISGNGYDFVHSYMQVFTNDIHLLEEYALVKKLRSLHFLAGMLFAIRKKIEARKEAFKKTKTFSMLHGHIARNKERRHVIIDREDRVYLVDWENACFGERELEMASFLYENRSLHSRARYFFVSSLRHKERLDFHKVYMYMVLLRFDDLIEDFKKMIFFSGQEGYPQMMKTFLCSLNREKTLLMKMARCM